LILVTWRLIELHSFLHLRRITPAHPPNLHWQFSRGGLLPHIRRFCAISAVPAEPLAAPKCQFSAMLPHSRLPFRRINVQIVQNLQLLSSYNYRIARYFSTTGRIRFSASRSKSVVCKILIRR